MEQINFYGANKPYGEFSNFAIFPIRLDDHIWATNEHYYQAQKYMTPELRLRVRLASGPGMAKMMGNDRTMANIGPDWETIKDDIMRKAVRAKFEQHEELRTLLLSTGDAILAEHTSNDNYWGDGGGDSKGKNMLGKILMEIREEIKSSRKTRVSDKPNYPTI
jgi:hypothetical protein